MNGATGYILSKHAIKDISNSIKMNHINNYKTFIKENNNYISFFGEH